MGKGALVRESGGGVVWYCVPTGMWWCSGIDMGFWGDWEWCGDVCLPERGGAVGLVWGSGVTGSGVVMCACQNVVVQWG